jgi:hypothetical protein
MLPDSNVNPAKSMGYVSYSITPKNSLPDGAPVINTAHIYFDFNQPVATNTVLNTIDYIMGIDAIQNNDLKIYPNPANDKIVVEVSYQNPSVNNKLSIFDIHGQLLMQKQIDKLKTEIDISELARGIYFLRIENRSELYVRKFIKE